MPRAKIVVYHEKNIFSKPIWVAYKLDKHGNQVGACEYGASRRSALYNLKTRIYNENPRI